MWTRGLALTSDDNPVAYVSLKGVQKYLITRFSASLNAQISTTWTLKSSSSSSSSLGIRLQETSFGRVLIAFVKQEPYLALLMIDTTTPDIQILDQASIERQEPAPNQVMYSNGQQIAMAVYYGPIGLNVHRIKIDSANKQFTDMQGWDVLLTISTRDLYFDSSDLDTLSLLYADYINIYFARIFLSNNTIIKNWQLQLPKTKAQCLGKFLTKDTYLYGYNTFQEIFSNSYSPNITGNGYSNGLIVSNIETKSCYSVFNSLTTYNITPSAPFTQALDHNTTSPSITIGVGTLPPIEEIVLSSLTTITAWCPNKQDSLSFNINMPFENILNMDTQYSSEDQLSLLDGVLINKNSLKINQLKS
ncbi:hypothetical protein FGO68_gene16472 [Halteria grandinella]|uniref:Uncharacterized protein n=1 Tax=Halteria grandinella TaxID=5974 RepID=A0A8J8P7B7_HALGN|nr:hypothetical protein FGO68_gene16472 [Halteria grandinella]